MNYRGVIMTRIVLISPCRARILLARNTDVELQVNIKLTQTEGDCVLLKLTRLLWVCFWPARSWFWITTVPRLIRGWLPGMEEAFADRWRAVARSSTPMVIRRRPRRCLSGRS